MVVPPNVSSRTEFWDILTELQGLTEAVYGFITVDGRGEAQRSWKHYNKAADKLRSKLMEQYGL